MEAETDVPEEDPWTEEDEARHQAALRELEAAFEVEATATYGPPHIRARKNQRYVSRLVRAHGETTIRGILKALSTLKSPTCAEDLTEYDLDSTALAEIIQPFELGGRTFRIAAVSGVQCTVEIGRAYEKAGSGGTFLLERVDFGSFRIADTLTQWVA